MGSLPRSILLLASVCYGLVATNVVYLFYRDLDSARLNADDNCTGTTVTDSNEEQPSADVILDGTTVTYEQVALFTLGGLLHSLADLGMWHLTACACCRTTREGKKRLGWMGKIGPYAAVLVSVTMVACATFYVLKRMVYEQEEGCKEGLDSAKFLLSFGGELATVYLLWHPLMSTFFFTGLIWPIFPCIGGRPKELKRQEEEAKRISLRASKVEGEKDASIV